MKKTNLVVGLSPNMDKKVLKFWDEFFLGYIFKNNFKNKWQEIQNKRQYRFSNFQSMEELNPYLSIIRNLGKKVSLVLNNTPNNLEKIKEEIIFYKKEIKPDYYIVKDDIMIEEVISIVPNARINVSSLRLIFAIEDIDYLMQKFPNNINRIVFHRDLWPTDIDKIVSECKKKYPKLEFEIFVANEWCYNVDGFCSSMHNPDDEIPFVCFRDWMFNNKEVTEYTSKKTNCNICSLLLIKELDNINFFKIPWRWMHFDTIQKYTVFAWLWIDVIKDKYWTLQEKHEKLVELNKTVFDKKLQALFCDSCLFKNFCKFK